MSLGEVGFTLDNHKEEHHTLYKNTADNDATVAMKEMDLKSNPHAIVYCPVCRVSPTPASTLY